MTTLDLDVMFRKTPTNLKKLKGIADDIEAVVMRPFYPVSDLYRVVRDRDALQLDFMAKIDGISIVRPTSGPMRRPWTSAVIRSSLRR